jgi:hypothetical protein
VTSLEPKTPQSADRDIPDTEVIVVSAPSPVFVDSTGRRSRLLRRLAYAFGGLCMLYGGLLSVSLAGGPVSSSAILPLPNLPDHEPGPAPARPSPTPAPSVSTPEKARLISEALPRRNVPFARNQVRVLVPRPVATTAPRTTAARPSPSASATPTTTRPVESTTTPSASPSADGTPGVPPAPVPPVPPAPPGTSGGGGGGGAVQPAGGDEPAASVPGPSTAGQGSAGPGEDA